MNRPDHDQPASVPGSSQEGRRHHWFHGLLSTLHWLAQAEKLPKAQPTATRGWSAFTTAAALLLSSEKLPPAPAETPQQTSGPGFMAWLRASEKLPEAPPLPVEQRQQGYLTLLFRRDKLPPAPTAQPSSTTVGLVRELLMWESVPEVSTKYTEAVPEPVGRDCHPGTEPPITKTPSGDQDRPEPPLKE